MLAITPRRGDGVVLRVLDREPWRSHGASLARRRTGRARQPWVEVMDVVGFLPPPGRPTWPFLDEPGARSRLEVRLAAAMSAAEA